MLDQIAALPVEALPLIADAFSVLELVPHNGRPYNANLPDGPMRELMFGPDSALAITHLVVDHSREVHILVIQWIA